jgi:photosystem II stability/assembly factor-like uncharacterized protein
MLQDSVRTQKRAHAATANILFRSTDGGQTWQDISKGLPENLEQAGFFANESGLYLRAGNGIFHGKPNATLPSWKKEMSLFPGRQGSLAPAKAGIIAYNFDGQFLQQVKGTGAWQPVFKNFQGREVRTVFETAGGTLFIGANNQLFKSTDDGKTWKTLHNGGGVMQMAESNAVLLATGTQGILRSTDDGENWNWVIREGGVGIAVERIKGGFAAITYNAQSRTRRVRTSYDGGNTWQPIDAGLQAKAFDNPIWQPIHASMQAQGGVDSAWRPINDLPAEAFISSIIQVGENFFVGHPAGIFRSSDKGRSWKLVLPSINDKVFNLYVSGNMIYAVPRNGGC